MLESLRRLTCKQGPLNRLDERNLYQHGFRNSVALLSRSGLEATAMQECKPIRSSAHQVSAPNYTLHLERPRCK